MLVGKLNGIPKLQTNLGATLALKGTTEVTVVFLSFLRGAPYKIL